MNTDELERAVCEARRRVLRIQTKLHRWARDDPHRRFDDLFNLVADPAFLLVAWDRVSGNKGAATAGVDGATARPSRRCRGSRSSSTSCGHSLKDRSFRPLPVRERMIPKADGKLRRLGIPTMADRVVQASLKLVLEPIFEADFCRVPTVSARNAGLMTRWPRCVTSTRSTLLRVDRRGRHQGLLRRNLASGAHGPGAASESGTNASWLW